MLIVGQDCAGCDVDDVFVSRCAQTALECIVSGVSCGVRVCAYALDYPQSCVISLMMITQIHLNSRIGFQS